MTLRCLFVDFDSFFASVEQNDAPHLRGRPVAVIPVASTTTCCIAASKEAKRDFGIKTGTGVAEALQRCPDIALQIARPARYVRVHHQFLEAIQTCIPHGKAASVDEVPCWLIGRERQRHNAIAIARNIKQALRDTGFSDSLSCSIGIAPNKFLAKTASDMNKPDGLTVIEQADRDDYALEVFAQLGEIYLVRTAYDGVVESISRIRDCLAIYTAVRAGQRPDLAGQVSMSDAEVDHMMGSRPMKAAATVIIFGRARLTAPCTIASSSSRVLLRRPRRFASS